MNLQVCYFSKQKEKENEDLHLGPWNDLGFTEMPLAGARNRGGGGRYFPARRRLAGGGDGVQG